MRPPGIRPTRWQVRCLSLEQASVQSVPGPRCARNPANPPEEPIARVDRLPPSPIPRGVARVVIRAASSSAHAGWRIAPVAFPDRPRQPRTVSDHPDALESRTDSDSRQLSLAPSEPHRRGSDGALPSRVNFRFPRNQRLQEGSISESYRRSRLHPAIFGSRLRLNMTTCQLPGSRDDDAQRALLDMRLKDALTS